MAASAAAVGRSRLIFQNLPESAFTACSVGEAMPVLGPPYDSQAQTCLPLAFPPLALPATTGKSFYRRAQVMTAVPYRRITDEQEGARLQLTQLRLGVYCREAK